MWYDFFLPASSFASVNLRADRSSIKFAIAIRDAKESAYIARDRRRHDGGINIAWKVFRNRAFFFRSSIRTRARAAAHRNDSIAVNARRVRTSARLG